MANQEQLERLKNSTVEEWNQWRNVYNFQNAQISGGFAGIDYNGNVNNNNINTNPNDKNSS
ncbi:MAG: hypothetical protein AB4060_00510 [Crocosphaera sp.]